MTNKIAQSTVADYIGAWRLVSAVQVFDDGERGDEFGQPADGYLLYTEDGAVSAVLGSMRRPSFAESDPASGADHEYGSARHLIAYAGRWSFDPDTSQMTHHIDISLFPNWQGHGQIRRVSRHEDILAITGSPRVDAHGRGFHVDLAWRRVRPGPVDLDSSVI